MQLLISDANIVIDMEEGGLADLFFELPVADFWRNRSNQIGSARKRASRQLR